MTDDENTPNPTSGGGSSPSEQPTGPTGGSQPRRRTPAARPSSDVKKTPVAKMILITVIGMAVLFGIGFGIGQLFQSDGTTGTEGTAEPEACVTVNVTPTPLPPSEIQVTVLNASAPAGSASTAAEALSGAGFQIGDVANGTTDTAGVPAVIRYGPTSAAAATTLAAYLTGEVEVQEAADVVGVELILIAPFQGLVDSATAQAELTRPIPTTSGPGCDPAAPVAPADPNAVPEPTPAAA